MGTLSIPESGSIYIDSQVLIYTVEKHPRYLPLLRPLWDALDLGQIEITDTDRKFDSAGACVCRPG